MPQDFLKSRKNDLALLVRKTGLDLRKFSWMHAENYSLAATSASRLVYSGTGYFFQLEIGTFGGWAYRTSFSPGLKELSERANFLSWGDLLLFFEQWLASLAAEIEPDLWETLSSEEEITNLSTSNDNSPFQPSERVKIAEVLGAIRSHILVNSDLHDEQVALLDARLSYMQEASERLGRKDWINLALGASLSIVTGLALDPDTARAAMQLLAEAISWLSRHPLMLP